MGQSYHLRKDMKIKIFDVKTNILTSWCDAHCGVEFFELCDQISRGNRTRIRKYFSLFYQVPRWVRIMKKTGGQKPRDTLLSSPTRLQLSMSFIFLVR